MVLLVMKGVTSAAYLLTRVSFMVRGGTDFRSFWLGWFGLMVCNRNCFDNISLCAFTGIMRASEWRWSMSVVMVHPRAVLRAVFWDVWRSFLPIGIAQWWGTDWRTIAENGFVYSMWVVRRTSVFIPQVLPVSTLSILFRLFTLSLTLLSWFLKVRSGSMITPRILGP